MRESVSEGPLPVRLYTLPGCASCSYARWLLRRRGVQFEEVSGVGVRGFRGELVSKTGRPTVPQIVIGGKPVGGADDLARLDRKGVLLSLVNDEAFPRAIVRRRLSTVATVRWLFTLGRDGRRPPWRFRVELVDREGRVLERRPARTADEADSIAGSLC